MEGSLSTDNIITSFKNLQTDSKEHEALKQIIQNFLNSDPEMAIKHNQQREKCIYTVPIQPPVNNYSQERSKSIKEAKLAFLNSTVNHNMAVNDAKKEKYTVHYAEIAVTSQSKDSRSTGGGSKEDSRTNKPNSPTETSPKKKEQQRKVSFKIKTASTSSHRRPPLATKTMTISGTKVSELTNKFNGLFNESHKSIKQSEIIRTIEKLQTNPRNSSSENSSSSSTLSSSPNIKIVLRQRRGSKKRNGRKRCSSADSIDRLVLSDNSSNKVCVIRSKSDGVKLPKSPKKRLKYPETNFENKKGVDAIDGKDNKVTENKDPLEQIKSKNLVKNVIKKFEGELIAQTNTHTLPRNNKNTPKEPINLMKEKPKVPEKKSSLVLTKNIVIKNGVPKLKTVKPVVETPPRAPPRTPPKVNEKKINSKIEMPFHIEPKKEPIYDKKKFKTSYIHSEKLPLHLVEIIHEDKNECVDISESKNSEIFENKQSIQSIDNTDNLSKKTSSTREELNNSNTTITPNTSFLWSRKSNSQLYSEYEKSDNSYGTTNIFDDSNDDHSLTSTTSTLTEDYYKIETPESHQESSDFETNLVEAYNKEVMIGFTSKPNKVPVVEDDYEPLEPVETVNNNIIQNRSLERKSKINCPLPEIPKENQPKTSSKENIYQCLLEMRSHPEGDEISLHNYELCVNKMEERTRGDGDSDDGYEYCKSPIKPYCHTSSNGIYIAEDYNPYAPNTNYIISKSVSSTSTVSYEKIGSERIYEKIPMRPPKSKDTSPNSCRNSIISSDYTGYGDGENIYDTIKNGDVASLSHCYESIPNSPSLNKIQNDTRKQLPSVVQKRLSFDTMSNISQSTLSSEQKTNSIYGQRSVMSYNGQEIAFQTPGSESSVSGSDRSDEWVDVSDEEKGEQRIVIVREKTRGRKSPISWSQKVRHQRHKSPQTKPKEKVLITSSSVVYLTTNVKSPYYSHNDEKAVQLNQREKAQKIKEAKIQKLVEYLEDQWWLSVRTVLRIGDIEIQDLVAFFDGDSSDSGHLYESLEPAPTHYDDDFDSFDSDSDSDTQYEKDTQSSTCPDSRLERLPAPPTSGQYTLTKFASAAQRKMKELKRNLTKRYSEVIDSKTLMKLTPQPNGQDNNKSKSPIYANFQRPEIHHYTNVNFEKPIIEEKLKDELKYAIGEKRFDSPPPLPEKPPLEKPTTPQEGKKEIGTMSRKAYFSFKSRFRRASSMAVDINNTDVPSALKITNSTFYLTDSMDGDSGFSNSSDSPQTSSSTTSTVSVPSATSVCPALGGPRGGRLRGPWSESSPCLSRPTLPPPPPPPGATADLAAVNQGTPPPVPRRHNRELKRLLPNISRKDKGPRTRTSWYAECGVGLDETVSRPSSTSWYAEAGLYQAGNISSSSGASSGSHSASPVPHSMFTHEPLYQFYNQTKIESACRENTDSDSDAYESTPIPAVSDTPDEEDRGERSETEGETGLTSRPSAMTLVAPRGPARTLWCEVPEVVRSTVLSSLAPAQKKLQEAKFELLTSEASYLNSLNVLESHFISHPAFRDPQVLPREDWEILFTSIIPVRKCSQLLMTELEKCWQQNILLQGICEIVKNHAERHFHVYVKYCENQALMVKALQQCRERPQFANTLRRLESQSACQSLSLHSFLMLPMQRITRLPLLLDAVLRHLDLHDQEHTQCGEALAVLNHFVAECNEGARNTERVEEMYRLCQQIEFPPNIRNPPELGPAISKRDRKPTRWQVRCGKMTHLVWKADESKLTFGKKFHKIPLHLFLLNDYLLICKKKSESSYVCVDHCLRSLLEVCEGDRAVAKHGLLLTLLENNEGRTVEMLMSLASETEAHRWGEALSAGAGSGAGGEAVYAGWDCPQVAVLHAYHPHQGDELALTEGDVINVTRKTPEGWFYGERLRDGECGWFPGSYTAEVASQHVRARNLRQRYRLLALSGTYLGQKKKP